MWYDTIKMNINRHRKPREARKVNKRQAQNKRL